MSTSAREHATLFLQLAPDPDALPDGVRLRVALDVLASIVEACAPALEPRSAESRLRIDHVHVSADGTAELIGAGDHSGAHVLLWEVLAARAAPAGALPRVHDVVDEIDPDVDDVVSAAIAERFATVEELLEALSSAGESRAAPRTAVAELARVALGLAPAIPPPPPAPVIEVVPEPEPEPVAVAEAPSPEPQTEPIAEAPSPEPQTEPIAEAPSPEPQTEPVAEAPSPEPQTEPVAEAPSPEPQTEPVAEAPSPEPQTEPVAEAPSPEPQTEPVAEAPSPEPQTEPVAEALSPEPQAEPVGETPSPEPDLLAEAPQPEPELVPEPTHAAPEPFAEASPAEAEPLAEGPPEPQPEPEAAATASPQPEHVATAAPAEPDAGPVSAAAGAEPVAATSESIAPSSILFDEPEIAASLLPPAGPPAFADPDDVVDAERISVTPMIHEDVEPRSWREGASAAPTPEASAFASELEAELDDAWGSPRTIPPSLGLTPDLRTAALTPLPTASNTPAAPSVAPYLGDAVDAEPIELDLDELEVEPVPSGRPAKAIAPPATSDPLEPAGTSDGPAVVSATPTPPPRESQTRISANGGRADETASSVPATPLVLLVAPARDEALAGAVERSGHRFSHVAPADGERAVGEQRPAVVVLDAWEDPVTASGASDAGYELVRWMRTAGSEVAAIPLVLVTPAASLDEGESGGASAQHVAGLLVGADVCLSRPYRADELVAQVDALLRMSTRLRKTRAALKSRPMQKAFEGNLAQVSIATLLSVLEMERRTGVFEVVAPGRRAEIHFEDGAAVRGRTQGAMVAPLDALEAMLGCERGRFSFLPQPLPEEPPVRGVGIGELLLEALRRRDEQERDATNQSSAGGATH